MSWRRIALVGDDSGIRQLLPHLPRERVACLVRAVNRPATAEPFAALAAELDLPLLTQPRLRSRRRPEFRAALASLGCDSLVCNSYSQLIPPEVLELCAGRALNVHAALLPRHRGPNPLQWALIQGDAEAGATLHFMAPECDAGPVLAQRRVPIVLEDTWLTLRDRVAESIEDLVSEELPRALRDELEATPQDPALATTNPRLNPSSPRIDFATMSDRQVHDLIRAQVAPLAGAYLVLPGGEELRFPRYHSLQEVAELRARYAPGA